MSERCDQCGRRFHRVCFYCAARSELLPDHSGSGRLGKAEDYETFVRVGHSPGRFRAGGGTRRLRVQVRDPEPALELAVRQLEDRIV